ncbi:MAG: response regulator [Chloroflexi bacterium]|nr:MAG: response regulator [Chloroflexota bacterium]
MPTQILLVEDSQTQAIQIKLVLENAGDVDVEVAPTGLDGLRLARDLNPALIILDIVLPDMDGFQVCRRLKRDPVTMGIPVIMLTEKSSANATASGLQAGADDYIPKDIFAAEHLIETLRELGLLT